jgi:hypothetical protein
VWSSGSWCEMVSVAAGNYDDVHAEQRRLSG